MSDMFLFSIGPMLIIIGVVIASIIDHFRSECRHEYSDWHSYPDEHAYVQQKQCKKCQFVYTYQERKIGHDRPKLDT